MGFYQYFPKNPISKSRLLLFFAAQTGYTIFLYIL